MKFKPLLAADYSECLDKVKYPVLVSAKIDGIRCLMQNGAAVSRSLIPIPNRFIQDQLKHQLKHLPDGLDGELVVGASSGPGVMNRTQSGVMREDGEPNFTYYIFDMFDPVKPYLERMKQVYLKTYMGPVKILPQAVVLNEHKLLQLEQHLVGLGYEGIMIRSTNGRYKQGRSTINDGILGKYKRFFDAEATIVGFKEKKKNINIATTNALGRTQRSSAKAGLVLTSTLGAFVCEMKDGTRFDVGSGLTDMLREVYWMNRDRLLGETVKFKFNSKTEVGVPRFPIFLGFRDKRDT